MCKYLENEIEKFHSKKIPLIEYPSEVKALRNRINKFVEGEKSYAIKMLKEKAIDREEFEMIYSILEIQKEKYQKKVTYI